MAGSKASRAPLTRERVLRAAMEFVDASGLDALSMRALARRLDVEAMSLYYHAAGKEEILAGIADLVAGEIMLPAADMPWKNALRASALSAHQVLERHPWACALLMTPARISPARLRQMEALLATLARAGFPPMLADRAYHALDAHILGFTLWESGYARGLDGAGPDFAGEFLRTLPEAEFPHLAAHVAWHLWPRPAGEAPGGEFEFVLDLLLDSLEQRLAGGSGER